MVRRPGLTIRAYLAGQRVDHFRPLSLLFLITGLYALLFSALRIDMMPPRDPAMPEAVYQMQVSFNTFFMKYLTWCYLATVPMWALTARWFLRSGGYNYAECLIIASFITAINNFITLLLLPVTYFYSGTPQVRTFSFYALLLVIGYASWAYGSLLSHTALGWLGRLWRGFMTFMLGYVMLIIAGVFLMFALNWSSIKQSMMQQARAKQEQKRQAAGARPRPGRAPAAVASAASLAGTEKPVAERQRRAFYVVQAEAYCPSTMANTSGATMVASLSMMYFGVFSPSLPQVIFSLGTAPE